MRCLVFVFLFFLAVKASGQQQAYLSDEAANKWADSVLNSLSNDERIAQLMIVRLSYIDLKTRQVTLKDKKVNILSLRQAFR